MIKTCGYTWGQFFCENQEPDHTTHYIDDLTGKMTQIFEQVLMTPEREEQAKQRLVRVKLVKKP